MPTLALAAGIGAVLASGFLAASSAVAGRLGVFAFPALALIFHVSLPQKCQVRLPKRALSTCWVAWGIAALYGHARGGSLPAGWDLVWVVIAAPLGEELLFRGWLWNVLDRTSRGRMLTPTNPLPTALWGTSLAFAIWHLQNGGEYFQVAYTFWTGAWLGYLRWITGNLGWPVLAHVTLNLAGLPWLRLAAA